MGSGWEGVLSLGRGIPGAESLGRRTEGGSRSPQSKAPPFTLAPQPTAERQDYSPAETQPRLQIA